MGRRNYRWYLWMVATYVVMDLYVVFMLVAKIIVLSLNSPNSGPTAFWEACTIDPSAPIIILFALVFTCFQGSLITYHTKLSLLDETTNESRKAVYRGKPNPHKSTWWRNLFLRWCGPSRARYIKFHVNEHESSADMQPQMSEDEISLITVQLGKRSRKRNESFFHAEMIEIV